MKKRLTVALLSSLLAISCAKNNQTESRTETDNPAGFVYAGDPPPAELPSLEQLEAQSEFDSLTEESNNYKKRVVDQLFGKAPFMQGCAQLSKPGDGAFKMFFKLEKDGSLSVFAARPDLESTRCIGRAVFGRKLEAPRDAPYVFDLNMQFK